MLNLKACLLWTIIPYNYAQNLISVYQNLIIVAPKIWFLSFFGKKSVKYLAPVIWNSLPWGKNIATLSDFEKFIKVWRLEVLAGYAKIIFHVLEFVHSSFVCLYRHDKCISMGSFLLFKPVLFQTPYLAVACELWISLKQLLFRTFFYWLGNSNVQMKECHSIS